MIYVINGKVESKHTPVEVLLTENAERALLWVVGEIPKWNHHSRQVKRQLSHDGTAICTALPPWVEKEIDRIGKKLRLNDHALLDEIEKVLPTEKNGVTIATYMEATGGTVTFFHGTNAYLIK